MMEAATEIAIQAFTRNIHHGGHGDEEETSRISFSLFKLRILGDLRGGLFLPDEMSAV
jgi:hypothetical protein